MEFCEFNCQQMFFVNLMFSGIIHMHECAFQQRNLDFRCEICVICSNEYLPWVELGSFRCMDIRPFGLKLGKYGEWGRILLFSTFFFFCTPYYLAPGMFLRAKFAVCWSFLSHTCGPHGSMVQILMRWAPQ